MVEHSIEQHAACAACSAPTGPVDRGHLVDTIADRVIAHLRCGRRAVINAHFNAGDEIHTLRTDTTCHGRAVRMLAEKLRVDESGLHKWARMAEAIRGHERETLCQLVDAVGLPLAPSFVVELERLRHPRDRLQLARTALDEHLTARQFRRRINMMQRSSAE